MNQQAKMYILQMEDFKDKCVGTVPQIKYTLYIFNVFKYFVFHNKVFLILLLIFHVSLCPL